MKWSASFIVDSINRGMVVKEYFHARRTQVVVCVCIADAVIQWRQTTRILVVRARTQG